MIEVQHFTKKYGDKTVVKDITFTASSASAMTAGGRKSGKAPV